MSHQVRQVTSARIESLDLLSRAARSVNLPNLKTNLKLDRDKKEARYYNGHKDKCDAVITYGRALTPQEEQTNYEIAVKKSEEIVNGRPRAVYHLFADASASDRTMETKLAEVFEGYVINDVTQTAMRNGAMGAREVDDAGGITIPDGYRCVELTYA